MLSHAVALWCCQHEVLLVFKSYLKRRWANETQDFGEVELMKRKLWAQFCACTLLCAFAGFVWAILNIIGIWERRVLSHSPLPKLPTGGPTTSSSFVSPGSSLR
jgi:hypothetical protein